tara:strand:- start:436 stop:585 length:150 start_codon:yes stop_codon:yes gene_type:complete
MLLAQNKFPLPLIITTSGNDWLIACSVPSDEPSSTKKTLNFIFLIFFWA